MGVEQSFARPRDLIRALGRSYPTRDGLETHADAESTVGRASVSLSLSLSLSMREGARLRLMDFARNGHASLGFRHRQELDARDAELQVLKN